MRIRKLFICIVIVAGLIIFNSCAAKTGSGTKLTDVGKTDKVSSQSEEVAKLVEQLLGEKDEKNEARKKLIALGPAIIPDLITHYSSPVFTIRWEVSNILGYIKDPAGIEALVDRVERDLDPHIRWRSIWALLEIKDSSIPERFRKDLKSEDKMIRWNAAVGGSAFRVKETLPILNEGLTSRDGWVVWEAVNALGRINDESSVGRLRKILEGKDSHARREAIMSLIRMDYPGIRDLLLEYLGDDDPEVRCRVALALGKYRDEAVREALEKRLEVETQEMTIRNLKKVLKNYNKTQ
ncbi:MAG: hypothetical protein A2161_15160 [Candidatus Schekmanbacteria bacterium RBG_13_48_7]|uniref:HEAT repeat domain-containing protein n=1 Tax=Candidatus Schekmanbacteria bacterium RBG_13_48_7 TaxID=1817878 RepID=A0A1F7RWN3_9BACT|nr:MAG: hypothetical protein A2161_15160 [Candidatus Schekmanbacteria bacterium RBG_13_48_7]